MNSIIRNLDFNSETRANPVKYPKSNQINLLDNLLRNCSGIRKNGNISK